MENSLDHLFVLPGQTAKENGHVVAFWASESTLDRLLELAHARQPGLCAKARSFGVNAVLDLYFEVRLHDLVYHDWHGGSPGLGLERVELATILNA
jgi:hypothetical protein